MIVRLRKSYAQFITSGAQLILVVFMLLEEHRWLWMVGSPLIAAVSLLAWISARRRYGLIADTPTSCVASAAQGYAELLGKGSPPDDLQLLSHLTNLPCLWYRWRVEERKTTHGSPLSRSRYLTEWETIDEGESEAAFLLDDGTGECVIDPKGAEILTSRKETRLRGDYRHTEWTLLKGDTIYALGEFRTIDGASLELDAKQDLKDLLEAWKQDRDSLLERFDLDGNGEISVEEWGLARLAARREVSRTHRELRESADVHTLRRPRHGRHYLLSNLDPNRLARKYLLWSFFHLMFFFAALWATYSLWTTCSLGEKCSFEAMRWIPWG